MKSLRSFSLAQRPIVRGTLILTATGLLTRIIGFFYRIYLSRLFGEEGMGIYQLIAPVLALSFSLCAAAYQTAISKYVAEYAGQCRQTLLPLYSGILISLPLSLLCTGLLYLYADRIAVSFLSEPRTAPMLRILAFSVPFSSTHACLNGYFYGIKKTAPPAVSQLLEQLTRVGVVYLITARILAVGKTPSINVAILGLTAGELVSMGVCLLTLWYMTMQTRDANLPLRKTSDLLTGEILCMALPLTLNRIVLNLLQSIEAVSIPARLRLFGYDNATSLRVYGVLTGMAMPMIFFPNALTGSISVLLLPLISENAAKGDTAAVRSAILRTIRFCTVMGVTFLSFFLFCGDFLGSKLYGSPLAGHFIKGLGFLCPFLYLDVTLSSILQGLGKATTLFFMNVAALTVRLLFVFLVIPRVGISGYLWGILAGQSLLCFLYLLCLLKNLPQDASSRPLHKLMKKTSPNSKANSARYSLPHPYACDR